MVRFALSSLASLVLGLSLVFAVTSAAEADADAKGFSSLKAHQDPKPYSVSRDASVTRDGGKSYRFEVRSGDCQKAKKGEWSDCDTFRERAEITAELPGGYKGEHWIAFSIYVDPSFQLVKNQNLIMGQVKPHDGITGYDVNMGQTSSPGLIYFDVRDGNYRVNVIGIRGTEERFEQTEKPYTLLALKSMKGKWNDVVLRFDMDAKEGALTAWVNGKKVAVHKGAVKTYSLRDIYFKFGLYRSMSIHNGRPASGKIGTQIVYYDRLRYGKTAASIGFVPE